MNAIISLCHFCEFHGPKILYCTQPFRPQSQEQQREGRAWEGQEGEAGLTHRLKSTSISSSGSAEGLHSSSVSSVKDVCEGCKSVNTGYVSNDEEALVSYISTQQPYNPEVFTRIRQACIRSLSCEVCSGREGPIFFGDKQSGHVLSYTFYVPDTHARGMHRWYSLMVVMMDKIYLLNSWPFLVPQLRIVIESLQSKAKKVFDQEEAKCPQRTYRMSTRVDRNRPARSLQELTGDKNIYRMLHVAFLWILKACGNRLSETLLEGPPTEDSIIDMEKQEETEEGFIKIYMRKVDEDNDDDELNPSSNTRQMGERDLEDEEDEMNDPSSPVIKDLRHLKKVLGSSNFQVLAHHVMVGNQIIVSGHQKPLVKSFLNVLKALLPKGCCRVIPYSKVYEESWRCNFLGLALNVALPQHVKSSEMFVLVEIVKGLPTLSVDEEENLFNSLSGPESDASMAEGEEKSLLHDYQFKISSPVKLSRKGPAILSKMMIALENKNLSPEVVESCFTCLKEEWMNKVKVLFKFTKAGRNRSEEDTKKLLQVVGAQEEDKQLLNFWTKGLSVQYRTHILASSASAVHR